MHGDPEKNVIERGTLQGLTEVTKNTEGHSFYQVLFKQQTEQNILGHVLLLVAGKEYWIQKVSWQLEVDSSGRAEDS